MMATRKTRREVKPDPFAAYPAYSTDPVKPRVGPGVDYSRIGGPGREFVRWERKMRSGKSSRDGNREMKTGRGGS